MAVAKLKDSEVAAERVECFVWSHISRRICTGRHHPRHRPAFEVRFELLAYS